jgi:hypothetical protein
MYASRFRKLREEEDTTSASEGEGQQQQPFEFSSRRRSICVASYSEFC